MASTRTAVGRWLARALDEGQESFGAYEITLGAAVLAGLLVAWWLRERPVWGGILMGLGLLAALYGGNRLERDYLYTLGRRRFRGTLSLRITWLTVAYAFILGLVLVGLASARGWDAASGWLDGPMLLVLTLGLYHLALGLKVGVRRWIWLGLILCGLAVLIPGVPVLREDMRVVTAVLAGPILVGSGLIGHLMFRRACRRADAR
jgi:hypothetical protein